MKKLMISSFILLLGACGGRDAHQDNLDAQVADTIVVNDTSKPDKQVPRDLGPCTTPPLLSAQLELGENNQPWIEIRNDGCQTVYYFSGCCGEGDPDVESFSEGVFREAQCSEITACCDALPQCLALEPGEIRSEEVSKLSRCCGTNFRLTYRFSKSEDCSRMGEVIVISNTITTEEQCDGQDR